MDRARLSAALANIEGLEGVIEDVQVERRAHALQMLRNDIGILDEFRLFHGNGTVQIQTRALSFIQSIAFRGFSLSDVSDVSTWCLDRWLRLVSEHQHSVDVLRGIGEHWFYKAQAILRNATNTHADSQSSGDSDDPDPRYRRIPAGHHSAEQVEARGILVPAADYLRRAVDRSQRTGGATGPLLAIAAEANIALGTITTGRESLAYLQQGVRYLKVASDICEYELSDELERYLTEYGQYVD